MGKCFGLFSYNHQLDNCFLFEEHTLEAYAGSHKFAIEIAALLRKAGVKTQ